MQQTENRSDQLLGEIETRIAGRRYHRATVQPGEHVTLEREPGNERDENAIRIENGHSKPLGYLPRERARWLAPLIDADEVRVEGYVPEQADPTPGRFPLTLMVFLDPKGRGILRGIEPRDRRDLVHETVRRAYQDAQNYTDPELVLELVKALQPLAAEDLHPKTHLLLALIPGLAKELLASRSFRAVVELQGLLRSVHLGEPVDRQGLRVFPLSWPAVSNPPYLLLGPAIDEGFATVEEVDEGGQVGNLAVRNKADRPLLVPEGDILVGAKQNRVVNITVLVAAKSCFNLPVSCVEQGRWQYRSRHFRSQFSAPPSLRSKKTRSVQRGRRSGHRAESDQAEVWNEVDSHLDRKGIESETASLTDGLAETGQERESLDISLDLPEDCVGVVVARNDCILGMDLFDTPDTFSAMWKRLSGSYLFDATRRGGREGRPTAADARRFLDRTAATARSRAKALGLGDEVEIDGEDVVGGALLYQGRLCHLYAFSQPAVT